MKNKLCMLLLASGIGLFSCAEQDLPKEYTDSVNVFIGTPVSLAGMPVPAIITTILPSWALPIPILVERVLEIMAIYSLCP